MQLDGGENCYTWLPENPDLFGNIEVLDPIPTKVSGKTYQIGPTPLEISLLVQYGNFPPFPQLFLVLRLLLYYYYYYLEGHIFTSLIILTTLRQKDKFILIMLPIVMKWQS